MELYKWRDHKDRYCSVCSHSCRKACPAMRIMDSNPDDEQLRALFRSGHCSQYQAREKKEQKK